VQHCLVGSEMCIRDRNKTDLNIGSSEIHGEVIGVKEEISD
jgi:hypothetical protein